MAEAEQRYRKLGAAPAKGANRKKTVAPEPVK
jgi:hypothetical protein